MNDGSSASTDQVSLNSSKRPSGFFTATAAAAVAVCWPLLRQAPSTQRLIMDGMLDGVLGMLLVPMFVVFLLRYCSQNDEIGRCNSIRGCRNI